MMMKIVLPIFLFILRYLWGILFISFAAASFLLKAALSASGKNFQADAAPTLSVV
jgi:hypothetical protein